MIKKVTKAVGNTKTTNGTPKPPAGGTQNHQQEVIIKYTHG